MVTHEPDVAAYCQRVVVMRDGMAISDTRNEERRSAAADLDGRRRVTREASLS
jgi:putative ABC transport system ATP-binding protein